MNIAITNGITLMPPAFAGGLEQWSSGDGTPGSPTYGGAANAALVPGDADFGGCLELLKTESVQRLRWMGQTPIIPGRYLRITARVKAVTGNLPEVRIAGWAGAPGGANVPGLPAQGPAVSLSQYGTIITVSAIVGSGARPGVDLPWGMAPSYGHFGLDLTGAVGGVVRIDDLVIEDVTGFFVRELLDWVDVRDFGAVGDGVADDHPAFLAAIQAAAGRGVLVSAGTFRLGQSLSVNTPIRFEGKVVMAPDARLILQKSFDFPTYEKAFGSSDLGFRKGVQALFHFSDHVTFDLMGRRARITSGLDVAALAGMDTFAVRRTIANGQIEVETAGDWASTSHSAQAGYNPAQPLVLTGVASVAQIPVGSRVTGAGVGREVYVRSRNIGAGSLTLSQPLYGAAASQSYTFTRDKYVLDFSGFASLDRLEFDNVDFMCKGVASGILLPPDGQLWWLRTCAFTRPKDRAITSIGRGCQGLQVDKCSFVSDQMPLRSQDRTSIVLNVNANDVKLRDNVVVLFARFAVMHGTAHIISGNHFYHGDTEAQGIRQAGLVLTNLSLASTITGNYIDNTFIELTNEYDPYPPLGNQFSFGSLSITGNVFICSSVAPWFRWIVVTPYGSGHTIQGLNVSGNTFRTFNGTIERVEGVDTTFAPLEYNSFRNIYWQSNTYNGITTPAESPVTLRHQQNTAASVWTVDPSARLPFGGWARTVAGVVMEGAFTGPGGETRSAMPYVSVQQGSANAQVLLHWPEATRGRAVVTVRVDNPL
ncbi:glycosyl hydrolase family 28-related protein [Roseicitreum antarcticum]|uniref:Pectate lyase superfamily protein n=1 Tax=Roseicitreum antarcticum TaxID=564137 RepID=A0A1H3BNX8_9RHOB|nr:glycosyl hydrolase family 28-related protein [Roseicitreum antarcticum]SDX43391.1 Pectate lyase superfamily protein [Roseicitreum antarcticum]